MTHAELMALGEGSYLEAKELLDGTWAVIVRLIYTQAIQTGVTLDCAFEHRYCYDDVILCGREFDKLKSKDDVPSGWIARRP